MSLKPSLEQVKFILVCLIVSGLQNWLRVLNCFVCTLVTWENSVHSLARWISYCIVEASCQLWLNNRERMIIWQKVDAVLLLDPFQEMGEAFTVAHWYELSRLVDVVYVCTRTCSYLIKLLFERVLVSLYIRNEVKFKVQEVVQVKTCCSFATMRGSLYCISDIF